MQEADGAVLGGGAVPGGPDQPGPAVGREARRRGGPGRAAADLGVGEEAAAEDGEPARAPALADVGPLVQHPRHRRRVVGRGGRRRGGGRRRAPAAGAVHREAAERVQVPSPHRGIPLGVGTITLA